MDVVEVGKWERCKALAKDKGLELVANDFHFSIKFKGDSLFTVATVDTLESFLFGFISGVAKAPFFYSQWGTLEDGASNLTEGC